MRLFIVTLIFVLFSSMASAETIGSAETKGILFKDTISVEAFDDPDIAGVTCYTTVYDRALSLEDSSSVSLSCRKTGEVKGNLASRPNVFHRSKNIFFKKTVVDRFYDAKRGVLIYLTYTTASGGSNASHSISVVVIR